MMAHLCFVALFSKLVGNFTEAYEALDTFMESVNSSSTLAVRQNNSEPIAEVVLVFITSVVYDSPSL